MIATNNHYCYYITLSLIGTCKSAVCVLIESPIESGIKIRIRIESFQLQRILIIKISDYK